MRGPKLTLGCPEVAAVIDDLYAREPEGWRKTRLLCVQLAARGELRSPEIAELCGISRTEVFRTLKLVREEGLEAALTRKKRGRKQGSCAGVEPKVIKQLESKLRANQFVTVEDARRWLRRKHGIERTYATVWNWLKKLGGVLRVPRPSHSRKGPAAAEEFRVHFRESLERLNLPEGTRAKVWVMDEARFGLHTELRRV